MRTTNFSSLFFSDHLILVLKNGMNITSGLDFVGSKAPADIRKILGLFLCDFFVIYGF